MSKEHLIPVTKGSIEAVELGRKGGSIKSEAKKRASKIREIKLRVKKGILKPTDEAWLLERIENPAAMDLDIINMLDDIRKTVHPSQRVALSNTYINAKKSIHGEKHINTNININVSMEDWEKRLLGDDEVDVIDVEKKN